MILTICRCMRRKKYGANWPIYSKNPELPTVLETMASRRSRHACFGSFSVCHHVAAECLKTTLMGNSYRAAQVGAPAILQLV